ncbi:MAG: FtsX-like permease family protein [Bryobacteraceae bacterium]
MTGKIVLENLKNRPMRSLLSILLIGVPVTLILTLVGLTQGMLTDSQNRQRGVGADIIIRGSTVSSVISFSGASIPAGVADKVQQQPHVKLAMGVINHPVDLPLFITGMDVAKFTQMSGGFTFDQGGPLQGPDDILVDRYYAEQRHLQVGQTVNLINHDWRLAGVIEPGKMARLVVPMRTLQELDAATGKLGQIYVTVDAPANINLVVEGLRGLLKNYPVNTMAEYTAMYNVNQIPAIKEFTVVVAAIGVVIGVAVVWLSMYMVVLQRTREIGILKALGASKAFILGIILIEAMLLGAGGTILGIVFSYGAQWLIRTLVPASFQMAIVYAWWPRVAAITQAAAILGALYPGLSAARQDPIEALAYE